MNVPQSAIAMGNLPQNAKPNDRALDVAGARAVAVVAGQWVITLPERRERAVLQLTPGAGSNHSEWRGVHFGVSMVMDETITGWLVSAYANKTGHAIDPPIGFLVYDIDAPAQRPPCLPGCKIIGHAGECRR